MLIDREKFRAALKRIDRSQAWVARQSGITRQGLQHYLDGRPMPMHVYPRIAAALGTTDFVVVEAPKSLAA